MTHDVTDAPARQKPRAGRFFNTLERISLAVERPIARLVRDPRFNPLYHTGTITVFLLLIIGITGVYLTMFYQFGFAGSYRAVANIQASPVGRIIRALHRYASDLAVIAALLHAWRTFFMDRFRGPRWLAWVTGVVLAVLAWVIGVTGYWLISDQRAQLLNETLAAALGRARAGVAFLNNFLATDAGNAGWRLTLILMLLHVGLSLIVGVFFWLHIRRLSRAKWLPPRFWLILVGAPLLIVSIAVPLGMLPPMNPLRLPGPVNLDAFYLFYLPSALRWPPAPLWGGVLLLALLLAALPWLRTRKPPAPVVVDAAACTGCTLCAADCPYRAITMVERTDGRPHKYIAVVDPKLCVAYGVCIGSCRPLALTLAGRPAEAVWEEVVARARADGRPVQVVFTCERHAAQGAKAYLQQPAGADATLRQAQDVVIPLSCVGAALPDLAEHTLAAGAAGVRFIGCPPEDCANREGNLWLQQRVARERLPKLRRGLVGAPIAAAWLPPDDFAAGLREGAHRTHATAYNFTPTKADRRGIAGAFALLAAVMVAVVALGRLPLTPYPAGRAVIEIALEHVSGQPVQALATADGGAIIVEHRGDDPEEGPAAPMRLILEVDGRPALDKTYPQVSDGAAAQVYEQITLPPGSHHLRLTMYDRAGQNEPRTLADASLALEAGQILPLHYRDIRVGGDPAAGRRLYLQPPLGTRTACRTCHSLEPGVTLVGPSFAGIAGRAGTRVPGMSAEAYLYQSIVDPDAYVVEGFKKGQMVRDTAQRLTDAQIRDLVAFLLTLK